jgi:hypothetical protein
MSDRFNSRVARIFAKLNGCTNYAVTISETRTLYSCDEAYMKSVPGWENHENEHKKQYVRYGWFGFMARYLWWSLRYGYHNNPLEREARGEINGTL